MNLLISGGTIIDPGHYEGPGDIIVVDGKIAAVHKGESQAATMESSSLPYRIIDARQKIVTPGLIDMHVHLREPGFEHKETIEPGAGQRFAAASAPCAAWPTPDRSTTTPTSPTTSSPGGKGGAGARLPGGCRYVRIGRPDRL